VIVADDKEQDQITAEVLHNYDRIHGEGAFARVKANYEAGNGTGSFEHILPNFVRQQGLAQSNNRLLIVLAEEEREQQAIANRKRQADRRAQEEPLTRLHEIQANTHTCPNYPTVADAQYHAKLIEAEIDLFLKQLQLDSKKDKTK